MHFRTCEKGPTLAGGPFVRPLENELQLFTR